MGSSCFGLLRLLQLLVLFFVFRVPGRLNFPSAAPRPRRSFCVNVPIATPPLTFATLKVPENDRLIRRPEALLTLLLDACYAWAGTAPDEKGERKQGRAEMDGNYTNQ